MKTDVAATKKKAMTEASTKNFYLQTIDNEVPGIKDLLKNAELVEEKQIHSGSDWSYSASKYASPNVRIAGDAGCFIDPFLSSGVHLALMTGLSAATTIAASMRGDCSEAAACNWHTAKVQEVYTRFLVVVLSVTTQIRKGEENVIGDIDEDGFDRAFAHFRPGTLPRESFIVPKLTQCEVIQGTADVGHKLSQDEVSKTLDFCSMAFAKTGREQQQTVMQKLKDHKIKLDTAQDDLKADDGLKGILTEDEMKVMAAMRAREMVRHKDLMNIDSFNTDVIDGLAANLQRGSLGLTKSMGKDTSSKPQNAAMTEMLKSSNNAGKESMIQATELSPEDIKGEGIPL